MSRQLGFRTKGAPMRRVPVMLAARPRGRSSLPLIASTHDLTRPFSSLPISHCAMSVRLANRSRRAIPGGSGTSAPAKRLSLLTDIPRKPTMNSKTLARTLALTAAILAPALASAQQYNPDGSPRYYYSHHHRVYYHQSHYRTCGADQRMRRQQRYGDRRGQRRRAGRDPRRRRRQYSAGRGRGRRRGP